MAHAVILEHRVPGQPAHLDWMIEDPLLTGERRLRTWRTADRPDLTERFEAERIGDHRAAYLRFEGDIGGGRGEVRRVATGVVEMLDVNESGVSVRIAWDSGTVVYAGACVGGARWVFSRVSGGDST